MFWLAGQIPISSSAADQAEKMLGIWESKFSLKT